MPMSLASPADTLARLLSEGGDARITIDPATGANRYFSATRPRRMIAYASSTANDVSADAFAYLLDRMDDLLPLSATGYGAALEALRDRIRAAYALDDCGIVFAPSGTDLEYVALAAAHGKMAGQESGGVHSILLGADEIGSGCIHSAHGRYFARETALDAATIPGTPVDGLGPVSLSTVAVRDEHGRARDSAEVAAEMRTLIKAAIMRGEHPLVHVVHGSKTGLILPGIDEIDALIARFGNGVSFVVDACQARITRSALSVYLRRGVIVLLTGSKFMGGPPFSGFALVPERTIAGAAKLPRGFAHIFRRAEWPAEWDGRTTLPDSANIGLLLRLEAAIFELERFQALSLPQVVRVIDAFQHAVGALQARLCLNPMAQRFSGETPQWHPIEMRTLVTLDISSGLTRPGFDEAVALQTRLLDRGIRLGQPVRCVPLGTSGENGGWAGTLRIGLSMPQVVKFDRLDDTALTATLDEDMTRIGGALVAAMLGEQRRCTA